MYIYSWVLSAKYGGWEYLYVNEVPYKSSQQAKKRNQRALVFQLDLSSRPPCSNPAKKNSFYFVLIIFFTWLGSGAYCLGLVSSAS